MAPGQRPWVIAHRGASAWLPEHTLEAYARAIADGADAIEPDLVMTRDGVLVARHENEIGGTTDVADRPEFAARRTRRQVDGEWVEGWFTEDFTLAELRTLRARERLPRLRSTAHDGRFVVPTFDEVLALAAAESPRLGRDIGVVPELKHPSHFAALGLDMVAALLRSLAASPFAQRAPLLVQCFEPATLRALRSALPRGGNVRLLQLIGAPDAAPYDTVLAGAPRPYAQWLAPAGLSELATFADALGLPAPLLQLAPGVEGQRCALVDAARSAGLAVFVYTFRPENHFLPEALRSGAGPAARHPEGSAREIRTYLSAGIAGFFTDDPAIGRAAVDGAAGT